jgi:molybdenum cofactor biosynthesis enzyme MoaA
MQTDVFCPYPFNRARVTCEGNVAMCCFQRTEPMKDYSPYIGNLLENTFDEIWFGDLAEEIRHETITGNLHKLCQCSGCPFVTMNKPYPKQSIVYNEYPNFLEIDLPNTHCNIGLEDPTVASHPACVMCERAAPWFKPEEDRLEEVIKKISHIMPNLQQIHIQGLAEPFWKNLLFNVLDWIDFDKHKYQCTISVTTNGTIFKRTVREQYLERCPHSITNFSIDAATPETYKNIRILPLFDQVLEHLYAFNKERIRTRQFLRVCNNINLMNIHEAVAMVSIAAKADVEYVEFNPTDGFNWKILVNEENCGRFKRVHDEVEQECKRLNVPYNFIRSLDMGLTSKLVQITL